MNKFSLYFWDTFLCFKIWSQIIGPSSEKEKISFVSAICKQINITKCKIKTNPCESEWDFEMWYEKNSCTVFLFFDSKISGLGLLLTPNEHQQTSCNDLNKIWSQPSSIHLCLKKPTVS